MKKETIERSRKRLYDSLKHFNFRPTDTADNCGNCAGLNEKMILVDNCAKCGTTNRFIPNGKNTCDSFQLKKPVPPETNDGDFWENRYNLAASQRAWKNGDI